jgi:hypothetical protein
MPVRRPKPTTRRGAKRTLVESRVKIIKNESGWDNAMSSSQRRYLVVHVHQARSFTRLGKILIYVHLGARSYFTIFPVTKRSCVCDRKFA